MQSTHTPGPWMIYWLNGGRRAFIVTKHGRRVVCELDRENARLGDVAHASRSRTDANLIAAAPDLLDALTRFVELMEECPGFPASESEKALLLERAAAGRAALRKATQP